VHDPITIAICAPSLTADLGRPFDQAFEVAQLLVDRGIDVNHQRQGGATALYKAVQQRSIKTARLLIEHGADVNLRPPTGGTPLDIALKVNNAQMVELLRSAGGKERAVSTTMQVEQK
jgi:ankyrin repeat protein